MGMCHQRHHLPRFGDCDPLLWPIELWQSEGTTNDEQFGDRGWEGYLYSR
jgi:hypothetical protein